MGISLCAYSRLPDAPGGGWSSRAKDDSTMARRTGLNLGGRFQADRTFKTVRPLFECPPGSTESLSAHVPDNSVRHRNGLQGKDSSAGPLSKQDLLPLWWVSYPCKPKNDTGVQIACGWGCRAAATCTCGTRSGATPSNELGLPIFARSLAEEESSAGSAVSGEWPVHRCNSRQSRFSGPN